MSEVSCSLIEEHLVDLIENKVSAELQKDIQSHPDECFRCKRLIKDFSELWSELSSHKRREPSISFWPALEKIIKEYEHHPFRSRKIYTGFIGLLRPVAISLVFLIGIFLGFQLGNIPDRSELGSKSRKSTPDISGEIYTALYLEDLADIPLGSTADFYLGVEDSDEEGGDAGDWAV